MKCFNTRGNNDKKIASLISGGSNNLHFEKNVEYFIVFPGKHSRELKIIINTFPEFPMPF